MRFPCEDLVKYVIPAIRAIMVKELSAEYGKNQKEIAQLLGLTQPSISYYLRGERGDKGIAIIKESSAYNKIIDFTHKIARKEATEIDMMKLFCSFCVELRPIFLQKLFPDKELSYLNDWETSLVE